MSGPVPKQRAGWCQDGHRLRGLLSATLTARLERILAIHYSYQGSDLSMLRVPLVIDECAECCEPYPCPTVKAALGEEQE